MGKPILAGGPDAAAHLYAGESSVRAYDRYMEKKYELDRLRNIEGWRAHYRQMCDHTSMYFDEVLREIALEGRGKMDIALIGAGDTPFTEDMEEDPREIDPVLAHRMKTFAKCIVVIDQSAEMANHAEDNLKNVGGLRNMEGDGVFAAQRDITGGLAASAFDLISKELGGVSSEEGLELFAQKMANTSIDDLKKQILPALMEQWTQNGRPPPSHRVGGIDSQKGDFAFSLQNNGSGDRPLDFDVGAFQMVLAGTIAHAEDLFWEKFFEITRRADAERGTPIDRATQDRRRSIVSKFFQFVRMYNTYVAEYAIVNFLSQHEEAHVLAPTDVNTHFEGDLDYLGIETRLDVPALKENLLEHDMHLVEKGRWEWHDHSEEGAKGAGSEHYHDVSFLVVRKSTTGSGTKLPQPVSADALAQSSGASGTGATDFTM